MSQRKFSHCSKTQNTELSGDPLLTLKYSNWLERQHFCQKKHNNYGYNVLAFAVYDAFRDIY